MIHILLGFATFIQCHGTYSNLHVIALSMIRKLLNASSVLQLLILDQIVHSFTRCNILCFPNGYAGLEMVPYFGKIQLLAFIGALEVFVMRDFVGGEFPGDLRNNFIDFGWDSFDDETKLRKRAIELNQGRAAQMGILALMVHEQLGVSLIPYATGSSDYAF